MKKSDKDLSIIAYILGYCTEIEETVNRFGNDYACFSTDKIYRNAVTMCILQIGELAGKLSKEFVEANLEIPWRSIKAMRNVAAHAYGSISIPDVWDTVRDDIPALKFYCITLLK